MKKTFVFLLGYEDSNLKSIDNTLLKNIKTYYLQKIPNKGNQICFYLGNILFPYQTKQLTYPKQSLTKVWINNQLNQHFDLFTRLIFNRKTILFL
ncbi:hypothetical protein [Gilliamella sp. Bif1-4]|uniref:hypothetical protein n=1 Tax=Gilliamella sp. Bif1-4 TaxID=3120233 RepID=UPI00080E1203|nr:hypothetical protein [Gilliamella apicola]OCG42757.1 hypothetical protein A9G25_01815 [Gilliamella apicola]